MSIDFNTRSINLDFECSDLDDETTLPDLYIGLELDLLVVGDGIVTDRHHASSGNYDPMDPMNQISGIISPYTLSGWLRHGCEDLVQSVGGEVCHPGEPDANYQLEAIYQRDMSKSYHEKGSCVGCESDDGCIIFDLFGGFDNAPGKVIRHPIQFSPVRADVDVAAGEAEGHYRRITTQLRSRNEEDDGTPLRYVERDAVANLEGTWKLTLRELKPEFVGLLCEAVLLLDDKSGEFGFQLGGGRNFGAGMPDVWVVNPLYSEDEVRREFDRGRGKTAAMDAKDDLWDTDVREQFMRALQARVLGADSLNTGDA